MRERRGTRVLVGRCWEAGGAPAYWPWVQALRTYVRDVDPQELRLHLGSGAADLAQMLPELRELLPDLAPTPALESEAARFRVSSGGRCIPQERRGCETARARPRRPTRC